MTLFFFFVSYLEVARPFQFLQAVVDVQARPSIGGGIELLRLGQCFGFPIGEALALRNLLAEEDSVDFLQAFVFDAEGADILLQFDAGALFEGGPLVQHHEVILEREADLDGVGAFQQGDDREGQSRQVEAEQEAVLVGRYLEQGHLVHPSLGKRRARLAVNAHQRALLQVGHRLFRFPWGLHHVYLAGKGYFRQVIQGLFVYVSLDDELMVRFANDNLRKMFAESISRNSVH